MTRFATLWNVDCDFERNPKSKNEIVTYEPLETDAPATAKPCCTSWDISFYDRTGNKCVEYNVRHHHTFFSTSSPELWFMDGIWWEMTPGQVRHIRGRWHIVRSGWKNSRTARMMNAGFPELNK